MGLVDKLINAIAPSTFQNFANPTYLYLYYSHHVESEHERPKPRPLVEPRESYVPNFEFGPWNIPLSRVSIIQRDRY